MGVRVANGPVSWGVDLPDKVGAPPWENVFDEISEAGYRWCELGPRGYLPDDDEMVVAELDFDYTEIGADAYIAKGPFDVMGNHVLAAVEASEVPRKADEPKPIKGIESVYARQLTKELLSRNRHLETILESMSEGILEVFSGKVVYANASAVSMFGMEKGHLLASYPPDLFQGETGKRLAALLKSGTGEPAEIGTNNPIDLGGRLVTITGIPVKDEPLTTILLITDVTERKQLELQLQHVQKMEAIGTIAAGVAHNFRNTLTEVLVNTQVIQMKYKDESDIDEIAADGKASFERDYPDGVVECLDLFAELLDYKPAPKAFQLGRHKIIGALAPKSGGEVLYGPMVIYSLIHGTLKLISEPISSFDKNKIELVQQIAVGKQKAAFEGTDSFEYLKNAVLRKTA